MNAWAILGIPPGSDRDVVRRAYAAKLKQTNPEDDPAGFMQLREAYEWVLRWGHLDAPAVDDDDDEDGDEEGGEAGDAMGMGGTGIRATHVIIEARQDRPIDPRWADAQDEADVPPPDTPDRWRDPPDTDFTPPEHPEPEWAEHPDFNPEHRSRAQAVWDGEEDEGRDGPWGNRVAHARGGDVDLIEFNERIQALADCLGGDGPRDDARAAALFDALMRSGALQRLDLRAQAEQKIAALLADTIPRSDAVLRQAVKAFGWNDAGARDDTPALAMVRERMDDWRVIAQLNHHSHKLHQGWKALTEPFPGWPMRVWLDRSTVRAQVRQLLDEIDWSAPGLAWSIPAQNMRWWRERMERAPFRLGLAVPFLVMALLLRARDPLGLSEAEMWTGMGACVAFALLDIVLNLTAVPALEARQRQGGQASEMFRFGWAVPLAMLPPLALLAPKSAALGSVLIAALLPMFLWLRLAREPEEPLERRRLPLSYLLIFAFGVGILGSSWELDGQVRAVMMGVAVWLTLVADPLRRPLLRVLAMGKGPGWPLALAVPYLLALGALAIWITARGWVEPIYAAAIWGASQNLISRALAGNERGAVVLWRWAANGVMVAALLMAFAATAGHAPVSKVEIERAQSPGQAIVALQRPVADPALKGGGLRSETRVAMMAMAAHNPALYAKITGVLSTLGPLSTARARQDAATKIDALVNGDLNHHATDVPLGQVREGALLRVEVLKDLRLRAIGDCAAGKLMVDSTTPDALHRRATIHTLHLVSGLGDPMTNVRAGKVLSVADAVAAEPAIRAEIKRLPAPDGHGTPDQVKQCDNRLLAAMQLARLSPEDFKATILAARAIGAPRALPSQTPPPPARAF